MARIRTIKPEFPQSESMGRVSRDARLTFIMLWTIADDEGRLRGNSRMLASLLFPYDDDARKLIDKWLGDLEAEGCITRYAVGADSYVQINGWTQHQKIDKPSASKIPALDAGSRILANVRESSSLDQGEDQGRDQGKEGRGAAARSAPTPEDVSSDVWADYLEVRKAKKAGPITPTVLTGLRREASKAGISMADAVRFCCEAGWQGFNAEYYAKRVAKTTVTRVQAASFAERDREAGMKRWEEMTGRIHPDRAAVDITLVTDITHTPALQFGGHP